LWVMENFKKYIIPEIIRKEGDDSCNEKNESIDDLTLYQKFIGQYLNYESPFKDILLYHGVGAGKTRNIINLYNILFNYTPKWNVFLLIPAALHDDPWLKEFRLHLTKKNFEDRLSNIIFIHYDSPIADKDFLEKVKNADSSKTSIFIIEEAHKFINNVYNNISQKKGKRAQVIYDYIQTEKRENPNTRIMLLSATPVVNNPFEYALIFNLLRPGSFPTSENDFEQIFISSTNFASLNENSKNMFQRRILGLISYYTGATPDKFAQKIIHYVSIPMHKYFEEIYTYFENIEEQKEKLRLKLSRGKIGPDNMSTYSSYTRQACNFVFPNISTEINGERRPRPGQFKIKEVFINNLEYDKTLKNVIDKVSSKVDKEVLEQYMAKIKEFINTTTKYFLDIYNKDKSSKLTIIDDVEHFHKKFNGSFTDFYDSDTKKSNLFQKLYECSPKYIRIIFNILKTPGTILIYSNYVEMEGLQLLKLYMKFFGFIGVDEDEYFDKKKLTTDEMVKDGKRYCEFHGGIDKDTRRINKEIFNMKENSHGKYIKIIMISPAGAEGITLRNVRQVHILEPYWNEVRIEQVIGRAVRFCQHKDLPMEERKVDVFRYKMIRDNTKITTDEKMEDIARKKNNLLLSFSDAVKSAAVDCELFKAHNMMGSKYKCFQFNEDTLFEDPPGPAYQSKIEYDQRIDNGLNSKDSSIVKIKTRKITAVKKINETTFSKEDFYWLNEESGVVYDIDLYYPVGKIEKDNDGNFIMLDNKTYVISLLIKIPTFYNS